MAVAIESLAAFFPLTLPIPTPWTHPDLLTYTDLPREEELLRNLASFRTWWSAIHTTKDSLLSKSPRGAVLTGSPLLGPLSRPNCRTTLQHLTYLYESALIQFPTSFKLWKSYLSTRMSFVLGALVVQKRAGGRKKLQEMKDALDDELDGLEEWKDGLDPVTGWEEWKSLISTFERALMWLPKFPRLWLMYISVFHHPLCPPILCHTHARYTFDRALRTLSPSLHARIWVRYLLWAEKRGGLPMVIVYRRYLEIDPSITERFTKLLLNPSNSEPKPLEAAKLLLSLARKAAHGLYSSVEGKSPYQLLSDWIDVVEKFSDEVGLGIDELPDSTQLHTLDEENILTVDEKLDFVAPVLSGKYPYDEDEDPTNFRKLDIEKIIRKDGLAVYKDQAGRLWTGLATYWIKRGEFDRAKAIFERGIKSVLTVRDFTQIFDAYAEFGESLVSALMSSLENEEDDTEEALVGTEGEVDARIAEFEELTDRRPFLINDVLIRRNPNDVQEWEKRVALWGGDEEKVAETYIKALETINPRKATANFYRLYVNFAKFYEEGGPTRKAEGDLDNARKILERATKSNFKLVEDLAEVWCEWAEMEIRHDNYDDAIRVMQRATSIPRNTKINYHDHTLSAQERLFKSLKLWSFYVDLEESVGTVETTKVVYEQIMELRIANAQLIVNFATFLEENNYFEDCFKIYERGVELFSFPISFELWNIYLSKFVKRYGGTKLERARDLFEQALEKCPPRSCKPIFLKYAGLEEDFGLAKRAMFIYDRATKVVADEDKFEMFAIYIAKATANYGLTATRPIYEYALEVLPDRQTSEMCLRFASLERKLGEIDRARVIYAHASQFCDPRINPSFWTEWNKFEIETGSEETFREMLRIKRSVQAQFNTESSYLAAEAMSASQAFPTKVGEPRFQDAMSSVEKQATNGTNRPSFISAKTQTTTKSDGVVASDLVQNVEEIHLSDENL